jgi:hypothetical protein
VPAAAPGRYCCKSRRAWLVQLFQSRAGALRKNTWGSTRPTPHATRDFSSRMAMPLNAAFSSRRLSRRFLSSPIFRLLQQNRPTSAAPTFPNDVRGVKLPSAAHNNRRSYARYCGNHRNGSASSTKLPCVLSRVAGSGPCPAAKAISSMRRPSSKPGRPKFPSMQRGS